MDLQFDDTFRRRKWKVKEDVVISGISGRFPKSESVQQFTDNLFNSIDMMAGGNERFPAGYHDFPLQSGQIANLHKFDSKLFGIPDSQADLTDPQLRKLLEVSYEAIIDSGLDVDSLRGTNTGFFYGSSFHETDMAWGEEPLDVPKFRQIYTTLIPYVFDLKGPIGHFDTACGSSFAALNEAFTALKSGLCDQALVAGYNICLVPVVTLQFRDLQMVSRYGRSKCLDVGADGYGRSEGVCCVLLQRKSTAKRIYSTVVNCRSNTDGYKDQGISFPSVKLQRQLMYETYKEVDLDPLEVNYIEAHTTGTQAGDPVELKAIHDVFCIGRDPSNPLKIGCLKSNMGHSEAASGLCATIKANTIFQKGLIPANIHYQSPNPRIEGLMNGTIFPVTQTTPFTGELISLSCFGFGGANAHVILRGNGHHSSPEDYNLTPFKGLPRLVNIAGRSAEGVEHIQSFLETNVDQLTAPFLDLLNQHSKSRQMPHRGYTLIQGEPGNYSFHHVTGKSDSVAPKAQMKSIYLISPMDEVINVDPTLKRLPAFNATLERLAGYLNHFKFDLIATVYDNGQSQLSQEKRMVKSIAVQLALNNVLRSLGLTVNGMVSRSFGSLVNLYLNKTLSEQQTILIAYWFGHFLQSRDSIIAFPRIEVTTSWATLIGSLSLPSNIKLIEETETGSCIISGPYVEMSTLMVQLQNAGIMFKWPRETETPNGQPNGLSINFLLNPGKNGTLTGFKNSLLKQILAPENNLSNLENLSQEATESIVLIQSNHQIKDPIGRKVQYSLTCPDELRVTGLSLFNCLGQLFSDEGLTYSLEALYPSVSYPVPVDTLSLHSLIKYDHSADWKVFKYPEYFDVFRPMTSCSYKVNLANAEDWYLMDHKIDGRILFPATGLLMFGWLAAASFHKLPVTRFPVQFRDIKLMRATVLPEKEVKFTVQYLPYNGTFAIVESGALVALGKIYGNPDLDSVKTTYPAIVDDLSEIDCPLGEQDIYKELRVRGYDYGPSFRCLTAASYTGLKGKVKWREPNNTSLKAASIIERTQNVFYRFLKTWVTFTDSALQLVLLANQYNRELYIPTGFESLICDPSLILERVNQCNQTHEIEKQQQSAKQSSDDKVENEKSSSEKVETFSPQLNVFHDPVTKTLVTHGLWVKGLMAADTSRRNQSVNLETYSFVPFNETTGVDEATLASIHSYSSLVYTLIDLLKRKMMGQVNEADIDHLQEVVDLTLDQHSLASYLISLCKGEPLTHGLTDRLKDDLLIGVNGSLYNNHRFLRPFVITASAHESYAGEVYSNFNVIEINDSQGFLFDSVKSFLDTQSLGSMKVGYTLVRSQPLDSETNDKLTGSVHTVIWNVVGQTQAPSDLAKSDLIIYKLDGTIDSLIQSIDKITSVLKPKGHLLVLARENSTHLNVLKANPFLNDLLRDYVPITIDSGSLIDSMANLQWTCISKRTLASNLLPLIGMMFKKVPQSIKPEDHLVIPVNPFEFTWVDRLKSSMKSSDENTTIWLTSQNESSAIGLAKCLGLEAGGARIRCITVRPGSRAIDLKRIDFTEPSFNQLALNDFKFNIYDDELGWGDYFHLEVPSKPETDSQCLTPLREAFIRCLIPGDLSSLTWTEFEPIADEKKNQSLVTINYSALNFKDVMHATGRLPSNLNPDWRTPNNNEMPIGIEYSGIDSNGNRVMGIVPRQALATKVTINPGDFLWSVPSTWSMEDAATTPVVYATAIYALLIRGGLREGETVLIHAGTGGVGLAAINLALSLNCRVFTTVGTEEKRKFLQQHFPSLDETLFSSSRSTAFEEHVMRHTNGRGVDLVLNSLAEDKLQASVRCLAPGGRFLEIGKYDMMQNNSINVGLFDEGRTFHGILLDSFFNPEASFVGKKAIMEQDKKRIDSFMEQGIRSGMIRPLPRKVFQMAEVEKAFRFMAAGKQIGKVLVKIRDECKESGQQQSSGPREGATIKADIARSIKSPTFYPNKVYLIVGGFGGFGLELASWLVGKGARRLILNSRSGPKSAYHNLCLKRLVSLGVEVTLSQHDLTQQEECETLLESLTHPIGGIFNCALVLSDALIDDQTPETFEKVCSAKVRVTHNLDRLTRSLAPECDYFVAFTSVANGRGNPGQSNYGLANSYMESVCQARLNAGLHGLAIQWGYVGDVGFVVEKMGVKIDSIRGTSAQRIHSCFSALERALVYPIPVLSSLVRSVDRKSLSSGSGDIIKSISHILGIKDINSLDPNITLGELGMDSLMAIEVQQVLEKQFNITINSREIRALKISKLKEFSKQIKSGSAEAGKTLTGQDESSAVKSVLSLQVPTEMISHLNDLKTVDSQPVYYVPPIEGNYDLMSGLVERIHRPAIGLNWTYELSKFNSVEEGATYFADYLTARHSSRDKLEMVGYSFGGLMAYAITCELEARYLARSEGPIVTKLVLLDSDPETLRNVAATVVHTRDCKDSASQETEFIKSAIHRTFDRLNLDSFDSELKACSSREERFNKFKQIMVQAGLDEDKASNIAQLNELTLQKGQLTLNFRPAPAELQLCKVIHIRAKDDLPNIKNVTHGSKLGEEQFFDGNHHTFIGSNLDAIEKIVNTFFTSSLQDNNNN